MQFKNFLENSENNKKRILVLIHPECCAELGPDQAKKYVESLTRDSNKFDYIITHAFTSSSDWVDNSILSNESKEAWKILRKVSESISDVFLWNPKDMYGCSYSKELPDYLIENPESEIYMAGGYESNCLWIAYRQLFEKLNWVLKENKTKVHYYKPLIFTNKISGYAYPEPRYRDDFHPSKISYKNSFEN
jgi:hypothetical protein